MALAAQGWYRDPYEIHDDRYFSDGLPTKLVRDGDAESYDEPPPGSYPLPLAPSAREAAEDEAGSGLRRADEACDDPPFSKSAAVQGAFDVFDAGAIPIRRRR
jgi:hypothetical protein